MSPTTATLGKFGPEACSRIVLDGENRGWRVQASQHSMYVSGESWTMTAYRGRRRAS
jgi:hypothetical protein